MSQSTGTLDRPLRVVYLGGPGDAPDVLRRMAAGTPFDSVAHYPYSGQLFEVCQELGVHLLSLSYHKRTDDFTFGNLRAINRPDRMVGRGIQYHLGNLAYALEVSRDALKHDADLLITSTEPHPFLFEPLALKGVRVVPSIHATVLPEFKPASRVMKSAVRLSKHFYERTSAAILSHPGPCARQIVELTQGRARPIVEFLPLYRPDWFQGITPPRRDGSTFRVLTVGRLEASKGVFDLIEAARRIRDQGRSDIHFDVCGTGGALEDARRRVRELGFEKSFVLHGWTETEALRNLWSQSHAAVVPTNADFVEGFNQVVVEALLAGRPVITSRACPSIEYARASSIEVAVGDVAAYAENILRLADDRALYDRLQSHCATLASVFLDPSKSFGAAIRHLLQAVAQNREVTPYSCPPIM